MKKSILTLFVLTGCGQFVDGGGSVWQGGLWVIPVATGLGALWFWYVTIRAQKSGSYKIVDGKITKEDGGKMKPWEIGQFWFAVGLTIATIVIILMVNSDK